MWPGVEILPSTGAVVALGWLWGSFLNQVVDRTPLRGPASSAPSFPQPAAWPENSLSGLSLLNPPRSICLACGGAIPWHDNIPVFSYLWLRGRCRQCGALIGRRTLVLEVLTPLVFAALYVLGPTLPLVVLRAPWGFLVLSWVLLAVTLAWERRRISPLLWMLGAAMLPLGWLLSR